ncbi:hypothetical protein BDR06DRAFT_1005322 [Suillus hirtellus]|nr:hypothetical protein BDR06DRAFT_1005322 [Suillus hirtellus]
MTDVIMNYALSLELQDNIYKLTIHASPTPVKIPDKCVNAIRLIVHQLNLYQSTSKALQDLPKSPVVDEELQIYIFLSAYLGAVLAVFRQELQTDTNVVTTKWRSTHLDYHIALALHDNAFTKEQQAVALKKMKRSWTHLREKKPYKKVQESEW